ncbi:MFS transporter [Longispora sp. K20-0274]|uniref:MFS transporter n=1 Tax=Longispora sp. K20-0274 TaxID=3088255 RepID=UPI00399B2109
MIRPKTVLTVMSACVALTVALVAAVNLAIPELRASALHPGPTQLLWIVDAYVITFACLLIPAGAAGDRYGRKGVLMLGLAVLGAGGLLSAVAPGVGVLIAGRVLTGVGAALVMPATLSLAVHAHPPTDRARVIATWTAATGIGGMLGNLFGGLIVQWSSWRGLFGTVVPLAAILLVLVARTAPRTERHPAPLDPLGSGLLTAAVVALLYAIIEGPVTGWSAPTVLAAFAVAAVLFAVYIGHQLRAAHPVLDPRLFAAPRLRAGTLGVGLGFFALFAMFYVNAQYLQTSLGFSAALTGLAILPMPAAMFLVSKRGVRLAARYGARRVVAVGLGALVVGLLALSTAGRGTPYPLYLVFLLVMAAGMGLAMPALSGGIIGALPPTRAGLGSGLNGAAREIGSALGVATIGTALNTPGMDFGHATAIGYRIVAAVLAVGAVLVLAWFRPAAPAGTLPELHKV